MAIDGIRENLSWTRHKLAQLMTRLVERGTTLDALEAYGQALLDSSGHFVTRVVPWYKRLWFRIQRLCHCGGQPRIIDVSRVHADKKRHMDNGMVEL